MRINSFAGFCHECKIPVAAKEGYLVSHNNRWTVVCKAHAPAEEATIPVVEVAKAEAAQLTCANRFNAFTSPCVKCQKVIAAGQGILYRNAKKAWLAFCFDCSPDRAATEELMKVERKLTAEGYVILKPFNPQQLPLLRAFPVAWFESGTKMWKVSLEMSDRRRVLELAGELSLEVDPSLLEIKTTERADICRKMGIRSYQIIGVEHLAMRNYALLGDEMGVGKTVQTLLAMRDNDAMLVVCPSGVRTVWRKEAEKWRPDFKVYICKDRKSFRLPQPNELVVASYDSLPDYLEPKVVKKNGKVISNRAEVPEEFRAELSKVIVVGDEIQNCRNLKTKRTKRMRELVRMSGRRWGLSGTLIESDPIDLWSILSCMDMTKQTFRSWDNFVSLLNGVRTDWGYKWGTPMPEVPQILRRVLLRRTRKEVLPELPDITYQELVVDDIPQRLRSTLDSIQRQMWGDKDPKQVNELPPFEEISRVREEIASSRIPAMMEYIDDVESQNIPLAVFSAHRAPIEALSKREGWITITGNDTLQERERVLQQLESGYLLNSNGEPTGNIVRGIGISIKAGGVGLNLIRCGKKPLWIGLMVDYEWNPSDNAQAIARLVRYGQESNKILCVGMVSDHPLDRRVHEILHEKTVLSHQMIDKLTGKV